LLYDIISPLLFMAVCGYALSSLLAVPLLHKLDTLAKAGQWAGYWGHAEKAAGGWRETICFSPGPWPWPGCFG
jgi:hypothetical protein